MHWPVHVDWGVKTLQDILATDEDDTKLYFLSGLIYGPGLYQFNYWWRWGN